MHQELGWDDLVIDSLDTVDPMRNDLYCHMPGTISKGNFVLGAQCVGTICNADLNYPLSVGDAEACHGN